MEKVLVVLMMLALCVGVCSGKSGRTFYDEELMGRVKQKLEKYEWARAQVQASRDECAWLVKMSDQELWDFVPPPEQMRAINVCIAHDCPTCGDEVNRKAGHYPWLLSRDLPFKVKCPVCNGVFPKNDFKPWNTEGLAGKPSETPEPTDNGLGWLDKKDGRRYWFVPYYIFWQRWSRDIVGGVNQLKLAYLLTEDPVYAHKAAVLMAKIASEYERLDYPTQCYHEGRFGIGGRIMDYIWSTGNNTQFAEAYDAIYPSLAGDAELASFLQAKGLGDARELIETKMLWVMVKDVMDGRVAGNMGMHQTTLATLATVLANEDPQRGPTTKQMADWIMSGPGRVEDLLWNGFQREGLGGEASPGYSSGWCSAFLKVAQMMPKLGVNIWANPKLKKMADVGLDLTVAGEFSPSIGDSGCLAGTGPVALAPSIQGPAFMRYRDPRHAQALVNMGAAATTLFDDYFDPDLVAQTLKEHKPDMSLRTRNLGGYGCAVLEAGQTGNKRGLALYYGDAGGGHGHFDRLNIEMFAFGMPVLPEDGYPTPFTRPDFHEWRRANTYRHFCVMMDELPQMNLYAGQLQAIASTPGVQYVDVSAEIAYPGAELYRRTCALVDMDPDHSYLLDLFRVRGGQQHDWCYHAGTPEMQVSGGTLGPKQEKGTLAGEDVAYGKQPPDSAGRGNTAFSLQSGKGVLEGADYWKLAAEGWSKHAKGIFTVKAGSEMSLQFPSIPAGKYKLFTQYWDHDASKSELELTLGETVVPLVIATDGGKDYVWMSQTIELAAPADRLRLVSKSTDRSYILLNALVLSSDLQANAPKASGGVSSGFQGLWNVQRTKPQGSWSTSWTQPKKQVTVTMTMPAGCAQEVILADGEPEAQTGNPRTIKYAVARNESGEEPLQSNFVSVVEPHVGPASVGAVTTLKAPDAARDMVGVKVQRGAVHDLFHSALDPVASAKWQGADKPFEATGAFGMVTVDAQGVERAMLVDGTALAYGDFSLQVAASPSGKIAALDFAKNTVTLEQALTAPQAYVGREIILHNDSHQASFTVHSAENVGGKTVLGFGDTLFIAGLALAREQGIDSAAGTIETVGPLVGYGKTFSGRHQGRWLYNEDKSRGLLIKVAGGSRFTLDSEGVDLAAIYKDANGDGRTELWISEIGPGDAFRLPATTWVQRVRPNVYEVQTMTAAQVTVPK